MRFTRYFLLLFLFAMMTACGSDKQDRAGNTASVADGQPAPAAVEQTAIQSAQRPELGYRPDAELKQQLQAELLDIAQSRKANASDEAIPTMINELRSLFRSLSVTARALDRSGSFGGEIRAQIARFDAADRKEGRDGAKIMNGMLGAYEMYALLAKMKFLGQADRQKDIQEINDITAQNLRPGAPAIEAAAALADACYNLTLMIMLEIDSEQRYAAAFTHIERQYKQGMEVAKKEEDHFINGMFRTFEISQLWALSLNPDREKEVSEMNQGVSSESAEAESVGTQMSVAARYLFFISYIIAEDTVALTL